MFMVIKKTFNKFKNCSLDKTGYGNGDFSSRNSLKLSRKKKKNVKESVTLFFKTTEFTEYWRCFSFFNCINQTFHQKKCSWDNTGEGNVVLDFAISTQKYPVIVTQEKEKNKESATLFIKLRCFLQSSYVVFHMFRLIN